MGILLPNMGIFKSHSGMPSYQCGCALAPIATMERHLPWLRVPRTECLALLGVGFQVRALDQVDAVRDGREHGVQAVVDR